jgi:putative transposase
MTSARMRSSSRAQTDAGMPGMVGTKKYKPEEVVAELRQVDVLVSQGQSVADAIRAIGVTEVTCDRWRRSSAG